MKKIISLGIVCLSSAFLIVGCGKNQDAAFTNLANQLDLLNNTVDSVSRTENNLPTLSSLTQDQIKSYSGIYQSTQDVLNHQDRLKTIILAKTSIIKSKISTRALKLANQNTKALTDLTQALAKDTKSLNETKSELKNSVKQFGNTIKSNNVTTAQVSAKINRLSNCIESQNCFYKNLINTLNNIENILEIDDYSFDYSSIRSPFINPQNENKNDYQELYYEFLINQNLAKDKDENNKQESCESCDESNKKENNISYNIYNNPNGFNGLYGYNQFSPYGNQLSGPFGYRNFPYGYNYGYGYVRANPGRNTDSYFPWISNIDTYKLSPSNKIFGNYNLNRSLPVTNSNEINKKDTAPEITDSAENKADEIKKEIQNKENLFVESFTKQKLVNIDQDNTKNFAGKTFRAIEYKENFLEKLKDKKKLEKNKPVFFLDVNKKIEDLIKGKIKDTFNEESFLNLR